MLKLYYHPLSSYCQKVIVALYENDTPFEHAFIDLGKPEDRQRLIDVWPMAKFPVLVDSAQDWTVPESSIIIEYLDQKFPGRTRFIPSDPDAARQMRMRDRFYDLHVMGAVQAVVGDRLKPVDRRDPVGVEQSFRQLASALTLVEKDMSGGKTWAMGDDFTMADCAASPALFYANMLAPFGDDLAHTKRYLERLTQRPSYARALEEARPYLGFVPV